MIFVSHSSHLSLRLPTDVVALIFYIFWLQFFLNIVCRGMLFEPKSVIRVAPDLWKMLYRLIYSATALIKYWNISQMEL